MPLKVVCLHDLDPSLVWSLMFVQPPQDSPPVLDFGGHPRFGHVATFVSAS